MKNYCIVKHYIQGTPKLRFIGKVYYDKDRENGSFAARWNDWFSAGWFSQLEPFITESFSSGYADADAYVGLMYGGGNTPFTYWIGMFLPENTPVPEGFEVVDLPFTEMAVAWLWGQEQFLYGHESEIMELFAKENVRPAADSNGGMWFFERYGCPRFTTPDQEGKVILDLGFFTR